MARAVNNRNLAWRCMVWNYQGARLGLHSTSPCPILTAKVRGYKRRSGVSWHQAGT
jgi:hypothetical protein